MLAGQGIMVNWSNWKSAVPADRQAWRRWHTHHMAGRLEVPGFIRGRRYGAVDANRGKMTFYELAAPDVLASPAYRELAREPFGQPAGDGANVDSVRNIAAVKCTLGTGRAVGGFALTLRLSVRPDDEKSFTQRLVGQALPAVADCGDITGAHFCLGDAQASSIVPTSIAGQVTVGPRWIVMIEGMTPDGVRAAFDTHLSSLDQWGVDGPVEPNLYQIEILMTP